MANVHVHWIEGVRYISPNSTVNNPFTAKSLQDDYNPFEPRGERRSDIKYRDLIQPRMWQKAFYWMAFIPVEHWYKHYHHPPLDALVNYPPIDRHDSDGITEFRVQLDNAFTRLENQVYSAVVALKGKFELPCVLPFLPNTRSYQAIHRTRKQLYHTLNEAREWFSVWLGALSYCVAMAKTREETSSGYQHLGYPNWRRVLLDAGLTEGWIDDMLRSPVGNFGFQVPRVGCILKDSGGNPDQPSVEWFVQHQVPVWLRCEGPERFSPGRSWEWAVVDDVDLEAGVGTMDTQPVTPSQMQTWVAFFREREEKYSIIEQTETPVARERRMNRMRNHPLRKAAVFEWMQDARQPHIWRRETVTNACKEETLARYRRWQIRYDPYFNEWDCCEAAQFGDPADDSDTDSDYEPTIRSDFEAGPTLSSNEDVPDDFAPSSSLLAMKPEVEEVFVSYYGFCPPAPGTIVSNGQKDEHIGDYVDRLLGVGREQRDPDREEEYKLTEHYLALEQFVDGMISSERYNPSLYDTMDEAVRPVRLLPRFQTIERLHLRADAAGPDCFDRGNPLYVFHPGDAGRGGSMRLATFSAMTALLVCRLPEEYDLHAIAFYLAQRGIAFRVLHPLSSLPRPMPPVVHMQVPIRPWGYHFTKEDYESYITNRTYILGQPHMQAMIRRGGIAWRLAIGTLGISDICNLPTQSGHVFRPGEGYMEDTVTTVELDLICGAYECVTDDGTKRALMSWWPLVRYFEKEECGDNLGHWSKRSETWFTERLMSIQKADSPAQPMSYTQWKSRLHGVKSVRNFMRNANKAATKLIHDRR